MNLGVCYIGSFNFGPIVCACGSAIVDKRLGTSRYVCEDDDIPFLFFVATGVVGTDPCTQ